jgi:hypothetical protein
MNDCQICFQNKLAYLTRVVSFFYMPQAAEERPNFKVIEELTSVAS